MFETTTFWESFGVALIGTLKVFAMGLTGFFFVRKGWFDAVGMQVVGRLIAWLTMPCLIIYRFATQFDPETFPNWWKFVIIGAGITVGGLLLGKLVALRHENNNEATMLVGFQNSGFFVLPMLQALLPPSEYTRASLMLFVLIIPFNASTWFCGSWLLLKKKAFNFETILTPTFCATIFAVAFYGLFHDWVHGFNETIPLQVLFGDTSRPGDVGAMQMIGDLTVPLATILLGASIADSLRGRISDLEGKRAALEVTLMKMVLYPAIGYGILYFVSTLPGMEYWSDPTVQVLVMLQFASPPAVALSVFSSQHGYVMKFIPLTCLICYTICLLTVPFFVALVR